MPFKSDAQRRLFYVAAKGKARKGPSPSVAKKFIADAGSSKNAKLPERLKQLASKRKKHLHTKSPN
jgi:hypothetical protein